MQIGELWMLEHPEKVNEYVLMEEPRLAAWRLGQDVWRAMERYARKERARSVGYKSEDEEFYSEGVIQLILPRVLKGAVEPDVKPKEEIRAPKDPAEGGDYLAGWLDVARAWRQASLSTQERTILELTYLHGASQEAIGDILGLSQPTVSRGHDRGIRKLQRYLGGAKPGDCPYSCECHEGKLRVRPGTRGNDSGRQQLIS
jgi:RNA polymerase sigma factor (sigma-70 family)